MDHASPCLANFRRVSRRSAAAGSVPAQGLPHSLGPPPDRAKGGLAACGCLANPTVVLTQNTPFEMDGDKAVLLGYNINSKDLKLN
jgi:hypothetical protein